MHVQGENGGKRSGKVTLESWKEIANYLQRDAKTARRWELEEGLPVHRHSHTTRSSVYAYPSEIDAWREGRTVSAEPAAVVSTWRPAAMAATILLSLVMGGSGVRTASAQSLVKEECKPCAQLSYPVSVSPDGKWVVGPSGDTESVAVLNVKSGKITELVRQAGQVVEWASLSPDRRSILYLHDPGELKLVANRSGSAPKSIPSGDYRWFEVVQWTPDSRAVVLWANRQDRTNDFVLLTVADGRMRVLKAMGRRLAGGGDSSAALSPDGKYLAYSALTVDQPSTGGPRGDLHIYLLGMDGVGEREILRTAGLNQVAAWSPDGKHLLYVTDAAGTRDLWAMRIQNGAVAGPPQRVMPGIGRIWAMGMTDSGSLVYQQFREMVEYVTIASARDGSPIEEFVGIRPVWSPDGKSVGFKRHRPGSGDTYDLLSRSLETGEERAYPVPGRTGSGAATWYHDGKGILAGLARENGDRGFHRVDLASHEWTAVRGGEANNHVLTKDDSTLYTVRTDGRTPPNQSVAAVNMITGEERTVYKAPGQGAMTLALSPDERWLAVKRFDQPGRESTIVKVPVVGGTAVELYTARQSLINDVAWTERGILFDRANNGEIRLMRLAPEGGTPVFDGFVFKSQPQSIRISPDGTRVAYSSTDRRDKIVFLHGVISALK